MHIDANGPRHDAAQTPHRGQLEDNLQLLRRLFEFRKAVPLDRHL